MDRGREHSGPGRHPARGCGRAPLDRGLDREHARGRRRRHPHDLLQRDAGGRLDPHGSRFSCCDWRNRAALRLRPLRGVRSACAQAQKCGRRLRRGDACARQKGRRWPFAKRSRAADEEHFGRAARRDDVFRKSRFFPRAHRVLWRHHAGQDARQCRGIPRKGRAGRRTARCAAHASPGRSAARDLRSAAHRLDPRRLRGAVQGRAVEGERHLFLRRQPWRAAGQ